MSTSGVKICRKLRERRVLRSRPVFGTWKLEHGNAGEPLLRSVVADVGDARRDATLADVLIHRVRLVGESTACEFELLELFLAALPEAGAALLTGSTELFEYLLLFGRPAMELKAGFAKTSLVEPPFDHVQRGHLFGDEEDLFSCITASAIKLAIVCDFPVPGGPWMT